MQILIVEDHEFNALCLTQLLQATNYSLLISTANSSTSATGYLQQNSPELVILDGNLCARGSQQNGPDLANTIWLKNPETTIVAWTDSDSMRLAFAEAFEQHAKPFNFYYCWPKLVRAEQILQLFYRMGVGQNPYYQLSQQRRAHY